MNCSVRPWNGLVDEGVREAVLGQERGGLVEVFVVADLEAEPGAGGHRRLAQHQRVMLVLLGCAQVHDLVVGILDMQADGGLVERAAELQVGHVEHDVAGADDVERRFEDVLRYGHWRFPPLGSSSFRGGREGRARNLEVPGSPGRASLPRPGTTSAQIPSF